MKKLILLSLVVLAGISACKKEKSSTATAKVKTIIANTYLGYTDTNTYEYDAQGRIASVTRSDGYITLTAYSPGQAITTYYPVPGVTAGTETFFLDANGIADSALNVFGGNVTHTRFIYDSDGHLLISKRYNGLNTPTGNTNYIWKDGNKAEAYIVSAAGQIQAHLTYNYVTSHQSTINYKNTGLDRYGSDSENPISSRVETDDVNNVFVYNYVYTYDSEGRIATATQYTGTGDFYLSNAYTYY